MLDFHCVGMKYPIVEGMQKEEKKVETLKVVLRMENEGIPPHHHHHRRGAFLGFQLPSRSSRGESVGLESLLRNFTFRQLSQKEILMGLIFSLLRQLIDHSL